MRMRRQQQQRRRPSPSFTADHELLTTDAPRVLVHLFLLHSSSPSRLLRFASHLPLFSLSLSLSSLPSVKFGHEKWNLDDILSLSCCCSTAVTAAAAAVPLSPLICFVPLRDPYFARQPNLLSLVLPSPAVDRRRSDPHVSLSLPRLLPRCSSL